MWLQYDCIYTARGHIRVRFLHVRSSRGAMNTSIRCLYWLCVSYIQNGRCFFYVSVLWFMDSHWNRHTHTHKPTLMGWQSALAELRWTNGNLGKEECAWRWSKRGRQNPQQATPVVLANTSVSVWKSVHLHKKVVGVVTVELYEYV